MLLMIFDRIFHDPTPKEFDFDAPGLIDFVNDIVTAKGFDRGIKLREVEVL